MESLRTWQRMEEPAMSSQSCFVGLFGLAADVLASIHPPKPFEVTAQMGAKTEEIAQKEAQQNVELKEAEPGRIYKGRVSRVFEYGAAISLQMVQGEKEGWIDPREIVQEIAEAKRAADHLKRNQDCFVKVSGMGAKLKLSLRGVDQKTGEAISLGPDDSHDQNSACEWMGALPRISPDKVHLNLRTDDNDQAAKANMGLSILRESIRMTEVTAKANMGLLLLRHSLSTEEYEHFVKLRRNFLGGDKQENLEADTPVCGGRGTESQWPSRPLTSRERGRAASSPSLAPHLGLSLKILKPDSGDNPQNPNFSQLRPVASASFEPMSPALDVNSVHVNWSRGVTPPRLLFVGDANSCQPNGACSPAPWQEPDECDRIGMLSMTSRSRSNVGFEIAKTQMHHEANQCSQPKGRFSDVSIASSASDSSTLMLNPGEELANNLECEDFVFSTLPHELSLQLFQCLAVSDVCSLRASCKKVGAPQVLVDHFAYLVDPARPDVYLAAADILQAKDKKQCRQNLSHEMQSRVLAIGSLFLGGYLPCWWQINPPPILKILAGMQSHCVKFPKIRTLLCKCARKLFAVPDNHAQKYLVPDLLDILYSGSYLDKVRAAVIFNSCSFDLGWLREECLATLRHVVNTTERGRRLHRCAADALDVLMTNSKMYHGGCKTKMKGSA